MWELAGRERFNLNADSRWQPCCAGGHPAPRRHTFVLPLCTPASSSSSSHPHLLLTPAPAALMPGAAPHATGWAGSPWRRSRWAGGLVGCWWVGGAGWLCRWALWRVWSSCACPPAPPPAAPVLLHCLLSGCRRWKTWMSTRPSQRCTPTCTAGGWGRWWGEGWQEAPEAAGCGGRQYVRWVAAGGPIHPLHILPAGLPPEPTPHSLSPTLFPATLVAPVAPDATHLFLPSPLPPLLADLLSAKRRLLGFDVETLYELHYQMITLGKVFCGKQQPNWCAAPAVLPAARCPHSSSRTTPGRGLASKGV